MNTIAEKLKQYRESLNLTQKDFAKELGVSTSVIAEIEAGRRKGSKNTLRLLAKHSNKPIGYWYDEEEYIEELNSKSKLETVNLIVDKLIKSGVITDVNNIDSTIEELLLSALKAEIKIKLSKNKEEK